MSATLFHVAHQGLNDRDLQLLMASILRDLCPDLMYTAPHLRDPSVHEKNPVSDIPSSDQIDRVSSDIDGSRASSGDRRVEIRKGQEKESIKIGLVSTNFYDQSIGRILLETIVKMHQFRRDYEVPIEVKVFFVDLRASRIMDPEQRMEALQKRIQEDQICSALSRFLGNDFVGRCWMMYTLQCVCMHT